MVRKKPANQSLPPPGYEKMWLTEWLEVTKHSRATVLKLFPEDVKLYDIRPRDKIRVQLQLIKKGPRDESSEAQE